MISSIEVTGTDLDGESPRTVIAAIVLVPSGALEQEWDNGKKRD